LPKSDVLRVSRTGSPTLGGIHAKQIGGGARSREMVLQALCTPLFERICGERIGPHGS
jgi:hypothetical protein